MKKLSDNITSMWKEEKVKKNKRAHLELKYEQYRRRKDLIKREQIHKKRAAGKQNSNLAKRTFNEMEANNPSPRPAQGPFHVEKMAKR